MSTTYPWQGLPEQRYFLRNVESGSGGIQEVNFYPQTQLMEVLVQGNAVYLVLGMPHYQTRICITFPTQGVARVYLDRVHKSNQVVQVGEESWPAYFIPKPTRYRFGMRLSPFLFGAYLPREHQHLVNEDVIINYPVLSSSVGHGGILVRLGRFPNRYQDYWLELYTFATGNEGRFNAGWKTDANTRLIARFHPGGEGLNERNLWVQEPSLALTT